MKKMGNIGIAEYKLMFI